MNRNSFLGNDEFFEVYVSFAYTTLLYWIVGLLFIAINITNKPKFLDKYKVQPNASLRSDSKKLLPVIGVVLFNQFVLNFLMFKIIAFYQMMPNGIHLRQTQSFPELLVTIVMYEFIYEFLFYYAHRLMHHKYFYNWIHKLHHKWTASISIVAIYAHPIEHIVCNTLPIVLSLFILRTSYATSGVIITMTTIWTLGDHSGYHIPFLHSSRFHDWHHSKFNECFGTNGFLDKFHGTSKKFEESGEILRHRTLFTLKSASELYPNENDNKMN
ncbi:hypothetical protein ACKWTF_005718 [Chironomus riparius]